MISKYFQRISFISPPRISQILLLIDGGQDIVEIVWIDVLSLLKNFGFDEGHKELPRKSPKGTFSIAKNEACDNVKRLNEIKHFFHAVSVLRKRTRSGVLLNKHLLTSSSVMLRVFPM